MINEKTSKRFLKKTPEKCDFDLIANIEKQEIPFWYPKTKLSYNGTEFKEGTRISEIDSVDKLFDKRALIALSILYNEIVTIKNKEIREFFKFIFTSNVHNVSKLNTVHQPRWKKGMHPSTSWIVHRYWIPNLRVEIPVWFYFEQRFNHVIVGKEEANKYIKKYKAAKDIDELTNDANIFIKSYNAFKISEIIKEQVVDYVFTDPPYGGAIQYFELSTLWASWLRGGNNGKEFELDYNNEITINPAQNKNFDFYHKMIYSAFREVYKVLKSNGYLTVTFHSTDIKVWNSIIKAVILAGFSLEKIVYQPPARASAKGLLSPYGSAVGDYYIRFKKPESTKKILDETETDKERYKIVVVETAKKIIAERGEPVPYQHILNGIIPELDKNGVLLRGDKDVEDVMKEYLNKEFVHIPINDVSGNITGKLWWLKDPSSIKINLVPLNERVEKAIINVLNRKIEASFDEILQEIFINFPNALTPETQNVIAILKEYAEQLKGKWRLKPEVRIRARQHSLMIGYLAEIGKKLGYSIWVGLRERGDIYNGKPLAELSSDSLTLSLPSEKLERVKNIDLLWIKDNQIEYEFEVENTTTITEAIVRGENIPYEAQRCIIIPEEREQLLLRKIEEPALKHLGIDKWQIVRYNDLEDFYNFIKRKNSLDISEFKQIISTPKEKRVRMDLDMFT